MTARPTTQGGSSNSDAAGLFGPVDTVLDSVGDVTNSLSNAFKQLPDWAQRDIASNLTDRDFGRNVETKPDNVGTTPNNESESDSEKNDQSMENPVGLNLNQGQLLAGIGLVGLAVLITTQ